jgi:hypothetical protein
MQVQNFFYFHENFVLNQAIFWKKFFKSGPVLGFLSGVFGDGSQFFTEYPFSNLSFSCA